MTPSLDEAAGSPSPLCGDGGSAASSSPGSDTDPHQSGDRRMPQDTTRNADTVRLHPDGTIGRVRPAPPTAQPAGEPPAGPAAPDPGPTPAAPAGGPPPPPRPTPPRGGRPRRVGPPADPSCGRRAGRVGHPAYPAGRR